MYKRTLFAKLKKNTDLNINSLLPKIDELRNIAKCSNAEVIGTAETKLDNIVYDSRSLQTNTA